jgi:anti-sigma B factor antagonist
MAPRDRRAERHRSQLGAQRFEEGPEWVPGKTLFPLRKPFRIEADRDGTWVVLTVSGAMDVKNAPIFEAEVERLFSDGSGPTGLLVDVSGLTFTDSSGIRAALLAAQRVNGRFGLIQVSEKLRRLLSIKGLGLILRTFPDLETAKVALT